MDGVWNGFFGFWSGGGGGVGLKNIYYIKNSCFLKTNLAKTKIGYKFANMGAAVLI